MFALTELDLFVQRINEICATTVEILSTEQAREIVKELNNFLYTNYEEIGFVEELGQNFEYISDFHKYWHYHHREILNIEIDEDVCREVAAALHEVFTRTNGRAFTEIYDTNGLSAEDICRVRILTANQDFRGSRSFKELTNYFLDDRSIFDEQVIFHDPQDFITALGISNLSQNDKRIQFAKNISRFIIRHNVQPYDIIDCYNRDVYSLRNAMINEPNAGYGNKKTDMFIRDMVVLGVWNNVIGFENIDVASDVNTIKVALRTGIMKTSIPLVSSFIDIFCYQYGYIDEMNARAWRKVWEIWRDEYPEESIASPCLLDYFIYNVVGKQFCKETLCTFICNEVGHTFKWHSGRNKNCQICAQDRVRNKATVIRKSLPCTDNEGRIAILQTDFYRSNIASPNYDTCPFKEICTVHGNNVLEPPKSISIKGQTGWETAYAKRGHGGGGLMA